MKRLNYFIALFILLLSRAAYAQQDTSCHFTLSGRIIDEHDHQALDYAALYIKETGQGTVSDSLGNYSITGLCKGTYTVRCTHLNCEPIEVKIKIERNTIKNFYPEHHSLALGKINITAKQGEERSVLVKNELSAKDLTHTLGQSLGESLKKIAGITSLQTGSNISKPVIHGLHSNRVLILNDGIRQEGQQWGGEHAPEIDPFIAGKLVVVKGANGVRYGSDAIAGVILVEPKPLRDSAGIDGALSLAGFSNGKQGTGSGFIEGNLKKMPPLSWRLQGTYKQGGNILTPHYYLKNTGIKETNFSGALGYTKETYGAELFYSQFNTDIGIFSGSHIGNLTDLQHAFDQQEPLEKSGFSYLIDRPYQHIEHELFKAKGYIRTGEKGKLNLTYARQYNLREEYDKHKSLNDSISALNNPEMLLRITTHTADLVWEHKNIKALSGTIGLSGIMQGNTYEGRLFIPNFKTYSGGAFIIERWKKAKVELEAGIRYDYKHLQVFRYENKLLVSPVFLFKNFSGTAGGIIKIDSSLSLNIHFGTAWRAPGVNELFSNGLHHGAAAVEYGNTGLKPEMAYNSEVALQLHKKRFNGELSMYYNIIDNFIFLNPQLPPVLTIKGAFPAFYYQQTNATFKGIDLAGTYSFTKQFSFTSKTALLRAYNKTAGKFLVSMPADRMENSLTYEWEKIKKIKDVYASVSLLYVMKQWRVPAGSDFAAPPDAYTLLNLESGISVPVRKQYIIVGFNISNLLNTSYRDYLDRFRYYADAVGRNFSFKIKIPFELVKTKRQV